MLWKSLFIQDMETLERIASKWGIKDVQLMASATLQRPYNPNKAIHIRSEAFNFADVYAMQVASKERVRAYLADTSLIPLELIFVGRNMNLVRANNKAMGSPVNRINLMALRAVRGLGAHWNEDQTHSHWFSATLNYWRFRTTLFLISATFYLTRAKQLFYQVIYGDKGAGFEDLMDEQMKQAMIQQFGMVVDEKAFDA
jgi:aarF domain-containing kinase